VKKTGSMSDDKPKLFADKQAIATRQKLIYAQNVERLNRYVDELREAKGEGFYIPYFDPHDAGIYAKSLFLLEAPGPKTKDSGFISRNNNDLTAKYMFELHNEANLNRNDAVLWNIVPWFISNEGKIRPPKKAEVEDGYHQLLILIKMMPDLRCIVLVGKHAQEIEPWLVGNTDINLKVFKTPHPSPQFIHRYPENRKVLLDALESVSAFLNEKQESDTNRHNAPEENQYSRLKLFLANVLSKFGLRKR